MRVLLVACAVVVLGALMVARLAYLNLIEKDFLQHQGDARTIRMEKINAHRGMIRDRNGKPMAVSSPVVSLCADPKKITQDQAQLRLLADLSLIHI